MVKEYEAQYNLVDAHNRKVIEDRKAEIARANQIKRE